MATSREQHWVAARRPRPRAVPVVGPFHNNGGFETAGVAGAPFESWSVTSSGSSGVTASAAAPHSGATCALFSVDAANSNAYVSQACLTVGKTYTATLWSSAPSGAPSFYFGSGAATATVTAGAAWAFHSFAFTATNTTFVIARGAAAGLTFRIDDVAVVQHA